VAETERSEVEQKLAALRQQFRDLGSVLVCYSGGIDSALVLAVATEVLGDGAVGMTAVSPSLAPSERDDAARIARSLGANHRFVESHEMDRPGYVANGPDRCFHCKTELFERLEALADHEGWRTLAYGAVVDDLGDTRPGMRAADAHRVRAPLIEAGIGKLEVRILARALGLRVWDKAASACLASRVPHGSEVTAEKLGQIERGEDWLRSAFGLGTVRLRHEGARARIEVRVDDIPLLQGHIGRISLYLRDLGFHEVQIDPRGYRRPDPLPRSEEELADAQS